MRLRRGAAIASLLVATCTSATARAQYLDWRTSLALSATYSRTTTDEPYPTQFTLAGPSVSLTPGLTLLADTPMTAESLLYNVSFTLPFTSSFNLTYRPINYSNHLNFTSRITLNDRTSMSFNVGLIESPIIGVYFGGEDSSEVPVDFIPAGVEYTVSGSAQATVNRQLSEVVSLADSLSAMLGAPFDPMAILPRTMSVRNSTTLTRTFLKDTLGATLNVGFSSTTAGQQQDGTVTFPTQSLSNSLTFSWSHQFLETLSLSLGMGAAQTVNFANPEAATPLNQHWQPTATATVSYHKDLASASLSYSHAQSINLFDASDNLTDSFNLRFNIPAGNTGWSSSATAAVNHNEPVGGVTTSGTNTTFLSDVTLLYRPPKLTKMSFSLRGQVSRQVADESTVGILTATGAAGMPVTNLTRMAVTLSVTVSYPDSSPPRNTPHVGPVVTTTPPSPEEVTAPEPVHLELAPVAPEAAPAPAKP